MPFDGTQLNETAAHLLRARRCLEKDGWCQGRMVAGDGSRCAGAALLHTRSNGQGVMPAYLVLRRLTAGLVEEWNDKPGRTKEEVFHLLDCAIALAMETE